MKKWLQEAEAEFEAELTDLWMNDPPEIDSDHDEVITEDDLLNPHREGEAEISE